MKALRKEFVARFGRAPKRALLAGGKSFKRYLGIYDRYVAINSEWREIKRDWKNRKAA